MQAILILLCLILSSCSLMSRKPPPVEVVIPEPKPLPHQNPHNYTQNTWAWGYTAAFAERFNLPKQWIEPQLKGVLAVASRSSTFRTTCGYGGNPDACWPTVNCQLELYLDSSIALPWRNPHIRKDFFRLNWYTGGISPGLTGKKSFMQREKRHN